MTVESPALNQNHAKIQPAESRAAKAVREILESGRPLTYIRSAEEQRVVRILAEVAKGPLASTHLPVWTWSLTEGMRRAGETAPSTESPRAALDFILSHQGAAIFHLKDFHEPLRESPEIRRRLRDVYEAGLDQRKFVVITSAVKFIPEELERSIIFLELRPPDLVELVEFLSEEAPGTSLAILEPVARALQGLTLDEARYALRRAVSAGLGLGPEALPALLEEKRLLVNRSGVVEYIADGTHLGDVGGLEGLKTWLLGAPQVVRNARFARRRDRAQRPASHGHSRLRQEPLGESHRPSVQASALSRGHDRDLLGTPRQARRRVRGCLQDDGRHGARGALVRRNRDGHHVHRDGRRTGTHLRILPHLDAGENPRPVRRRHRQPHRSAARRNDPQRPF